MSKILAFRIKAGMTIKHLGGPKITVAEVHDQGQWVANASVYVTGEDGTKFGFSRYDEITVFPKENFE